MSASKSGDRSSRKTSKATVIEESVLTINLTVSPAAPVARASIKYPVKLVRLRDISIDGLLRDDKSSRIMVEHKAPPGNIHQSESYHPR